MEEDRRSEKKIRRAALESRKEEHWWVEGNEPDKTLNRLQRHATKTNKASAWENNFVHMVVLLSCLYSVNYYRTTEHINYRINVNIFNVQGAEVWFNILMTCKKKNIYLQNLLTNRVLTGLLLTVRKSKHRSNTHTSTHGDFPGTAVNKSPINVSQHAHVRSAAQ